MGVNYDDCVLWAGLPVIGEDGTVYGTVGDVSFDPKTGEVRSLTVTPVSYTHLGKTDEANATKETVRQINEKLTALGDARAEAEAALDALMLLSLIHI